MATGEKKIRVGTIGYGGAFNMGRRHLELLTAYPAFEAEAVCDLDETRLEQARKDWPGIGTFSSVSDMLAKSDVELLVVVLPHNAHAEVTLQCLKAGRHVVVEKPFAITVTQCDAMIREAEKRKLMVSTFHNRHWDSLPLTIAKHVQRIGRPYRWESFHGQREEPKDWWRSDKIISGGIIYDWGAHFMEWMLQFMPYSMTEIAGYGYDGYWDATNEDELEAIVRFGNEGVSNHTATTLDPVGRVQVRLVGTEGVLHGDMRSLTLTRVTKERTKVHEELTMEAPQPEAYYENVHLHLTQGTPLVITPEQARRVIQILDYASQSFDEGRTLKAKYA